MTSGNNAPDVNKNIVVFSLYLVLKTRHRLGDGNWVHRGYVYQKLRRHAAPDFGGPGFVDPF
jgi:hypothetical protein